MTRSRSALVCLPAVVLALTGLGPVGAAPGRVADAYAGFRTPGVKVGGGYLGARTLDQAVVYRIDPKRRRAASAYGAFAAATLVPGSGKRTVTVSDTQRAAWIVSKYGAFPRKVQGAAVELAVDDLLVGGAYAIDGRATRKRLAAIARPGRVVAFAKLMLKGSRLRAGDYAVSLDAPASVDVGGPVTGSVKVTASSSGLGVASLPVTFSLPGAPDQVVETAADGTATATLTATAGGPAELTARVAKVPENRLLVASPTDPAASRVVVAQVKSERTVTRPVAVRAAPSVSIDTFTKEATGPSGAAALVGVNGAFFGVALRATLFGPNFAPGCTGTVQRVVDLSAPNGFTAVPRSGDAVPADGYYTWQIESLANTYNQPVPPRCGGSTRVQTPG